MGEIRNVVVLEDLYKDSETARNLFDLLAARPSEPTFTEVNIYLTMVGGARKDLIDVLRKLEKYGYVEFIEAPVGKQTQVRWLVSAVLAARYACGERHDLGMSEES